jgi:hypothetical protein
VLVQSKLQQEKDRNTTAQRTGGVCAIWLTGKRTEPSELNATATKPEGCSGQADLDADLRVRSQNAH